MNVLVTGGAGFIGSHLVDGLVTAGYKVRVVDDFSAGSRPNLSAHLGSIQLIEGDVGSARVADEVCAGMDIVLHHAALPSVQHSVLAPESTQKSGEVLTLGLLKAAVARRVKRFILASSCSVYGQASVLPIGEATPTRAHSPYAASKIACEAYLQAFAECHSIETLSLRYFNVFGPRQNPTSPYSGVLSIFLAKMLAGERPQIFGDGEQTRDFVFIKDVVQANLQAIKCAKPLMGDVINIGSGQRCTLNQVIALLNELLGTGIEPFYGKARAGDVRHSQAALSRASDILGYTPAFAFSDALREFLASVMPWRVLKAR